MMIRMASPDYGWFLHLGCVYGCPVSATQTLKGQYIYGFLIGLFVIIVRVFNPHIPEGVMLAILFMNVFAPLIDHYVLQANIRKRRKRWAVATQGN